jgi:sugar phosphate isomerase/epimerase
VAEPTDDTSTPEQPVAAKATRAKKTGAVKKAVAVKRAAVKQAAGAGKKAVAKKAAAKKAAAKAAGSAPTAESAPALSVTPRALAVPPSARALAAPIVVPDAKVALSTASVYPENTAAAFEIAGRLGYDGVEVMVWTDPVSQDIEALRRLSDYHAVPILAVHAPCLLITQRVWGTDPWAKLVRARAAAEKLGASTVVVHPPFRWQRQYARDFVQGVWRMADETAVRFAVENMYPWRYRDREVAAYAPDWDPTTEDYRHFTVDLSHVATSRTDALAMVGRMGDRLAHVHLADGSGSAKDEHLIPGRGTQPCAELLEGLARSGFDGHVVLEVNTRRSPGPVEREADLAEALAFTRLHLAAARAVRR